jgi:hypothetical protein
MTNDEKNLRELIQAALDGKQIEVLWTPTEWISAQNDSIQTLIRNITSAPSSYRIKPEVKTFTYQTRLFFCSGRVKIWSDFSDVRDQIELEKDCHFYEDFKWLSPAQTHTIEYTE